MQASKSDRFFFFLTRSFDYQKNWTDVDWTKADMEFKTEGIIFPVHSNMFEQSHRVRDCSAGSGKRGKPCLETCFLNTRSCFMEEFLWHVYCGEGELNVSHHGSYIELINIGIVLDYPPVVVLVKQHLEENIGELTKALEMKGPRSLERWLLAMHYLDYQMLKGHVMDFLVVKFDTLFGFCGENELRRFFYSIPPDMALEFNVLARRKEEEYKQEASTRPEGNARKTMHKLGDWVIDFDWK